MLGLRHGLRSFWANVPQGPVDAILGITAAYKADPNPRKINLGVGAYRDAQGRPKVLECVKQAEEKLLKSGRNKEYLDICGLDTFRDNAAVLAFGKESPVLQEKRLATCQSLSGTGALRIAGDFLGNFHGKKAVYIPNPTWGNHLAVFGKAGLKVGRYRYLKDGKSLDFEGLVADLQKIPSESIVLFHACAHNPTGVDPSKDQWRQLSDLCLQKKHTILFDMAYQGFATGNVDQDAFAVRLFAQQGHRMLLAQSFAKNMGLYAERVGLLSIVGCSPEEQDRITSQVKLIVRPMYSSPPLHGAAIVSTVLSDPQLNRLWLGEVAEMAQRIKDMRHKLRQAIYDRGSRLNWDHITQQIGMFCYTGLSLEQVQRLTREFSVYLTSDGRISIAGINETNVDDLASAIVAVTSGQPSQ